MQPGHGRLQPGHGRPADQTWQDIVTSPGRTGQTCACLAVAIAHADNLMGHLTRAKTESDSSLRRGGPLWTHTVATSYQLLANSGAYRHKSTDPPNTVTADQLAIHTWLRAPDPRAPAGTATVADLLEVDDNFLLDDGARPGRIARLVDEAQAAGVLRGPNMRVEVWHMADDEGDLIGHRIAVHRDGAILASEHLDATDLVEETLTGIDAAVAVLRETAAVAARLTLNAGGVSAPAATRHDQAQLTTPVPAWVQGFRIGGRHPTDPPVVAHPPDPFGPDDPAAPRPHR